MNQPNLPKKNFENLETPVESLDERLTRRVAEALATPDNANTQAGYEQAIKHYRQTFGGLLPADEMGLCQYIMYFGDEIDVDFPGKRLNPDTLRVRLSHLSTWHQRHFPQQADPTQAPAVRKVLKEISGTFSTPKKKALPLWFEELTKIVAALNTQLEHDNLDPIKTGQILRDKALITMGWWRGFRVSEIQGLQWQLIDRERKPARQGRTERQLLRFHLRNTKGDRLKKGKDFTLPNVPELPLLCPVLAFDAWRDFALTQREINGINNPLIGPVFVGMNRWGHLNTKALSRDGINKLLKRIANSAGLAGVDFSSHSMRRGLLNEILESGFSLADAASWVGHGNVETTADYKDESTAVIETVLNTATCLPAPDRPHTAKVNIEWGIQHASVPLSQTHGSTVLDISFTDESDLLQQLKHLSN